MDVDGNGAQHPSEPQLGDVTVSLVSATRGPLAAGVTSLADGMVCFDTLAPDTYSLCVDALPVGYTVAVAGVAGDRGVAQGACVNGVEIGPATVLTAATFGLKRKRTVRARMLRGVDDA